MKFSSAFTIIELIFVIVIIGILAAVAIPRLYATRNDAKVSEIAMNVMQGVSEIASYAVSKGNTESNLSKMSNGIASLVGSGDAELNITNRSVAVKMGHITNCITVKVQHDSSDDNLTITAGSADGDALCTSLQSVVDTARYPMKLRGSYVVH